jgi:hypothetical protein
MSLEHVQLINHLKQLLIQQGVKSMVQDGGPRCLYRSESPDRKTVKCAIGHLIPNSKYRTSMEDLPVDSLVTQYPEAIKSSLDKFKLNLEDPTTLTLLEKLQGIHDYDDVEIWEEQFNSLIKEFQNI